MRQFGLMLILLATLNGVARGELVGPDLPLGDGTPDGWSGIPVTYGYVLPPGESVNTVRYYAADALAGTIGDELYHVVPLIVRQEGGSAESGEGTFSVWEIGPAHTPVESGEQEFAWGSAPVPNDGNLYHPAALQWQEGFDNSAGGVVAFADSGTGMHYFDVDTTDFVPDEDLGIVEPELVLSDLTIHSSGAGGRNYQLNFETGSAGTPGDYNNNGQYDAPDINELTAKVRGAATDSKYDLNGDAAVNDADRTVWVHDLKKTYFGDANLDGEFNSGDFVTVFTAGLFETEQPALWEQGDWEGDGVFNSSDFVKAFQDGGYEAGQRGGVAATVPEPTSFGLGCLAWVSLLGWASRNRP